MTDDQTTPTAPPLPRYITVPEAARRIQVGAETLRAWARIGMHGCPVLYEISPKTAVFREDHLASWIESRRVTQEPGR